MIVTTYYQTKDKLAAMRVVRSKYPRMAAMRAFDNMSMNFYDAELYVIHDENYGKDHAIFVLHKDGRVETMYQRKQTDLRFMDTSSFKLKQLKTAIAGYNVVGDCMNVNFS